MIRYLILAAALLLPGVAWAEPMRCTAVAVTAQGDGLEATKDGNLAVLDMRGRWVVYSWRNVERYAGHADELSACVARELLKRKAWIARNVSPDQQCPPETHELSAVPDVMQRIIAADPVMRVCQPTPRCDPGNTCS